MSKAILLNTGWTFTKEGHDEPITLPHTWNAVDGNDGNGSYLRTTGVYTRTFTAPKQPREGGRTYVEVLAAALNSTVKVNGQVATTHEGGFSIFRADVTDLVPLFRRLYLLRRPVPRCQPDQRARRTL